MEQRYADYLKTLAEVHGAKLNDWEAKFVRDIRAKNPSQLSGNMKICIDKMVDKFINGKGAPASPQGGGQGGGQRQPVDQPPITRGRTANQKIDGGWAVYVDGRKIGAPVDYATSVKIIYWLDEALDALIALGGVPGGEEPNPF
jgi:hypothetical protein